MERIGKVWTTWERYDTLGRLIERATSHSEERTKQADSSHLAHTTAQAKQSVDSAKLRHERSTTTSAKTQSAPASSSLLAILKWLALALLISVALGIYAHRRLTSLRC